MGPDSRDNGRPPAAAAARSRALRTAPLLLPLALTALVAAFNVLTTGPTGLGFLVLAPVLSAALNGTPYQVAALTALITALAVVLGVQDGIFAESLHVVFILFEITGGALAAYIAMLRREREHDQARLEIQFATARALQEPGTTAEAAANLLATIAPALGWEVAVLWERRHVHVLHPVASWTGEGVRPASLEKLERHFVARPATGLPGEVLDSGRLGWATDLAQHTGTPRAELCAGAGLRGAVAVPLTTAGGVVGVMELFSREPREPGGEDAKLLAALGGQIGDFLEVRRGEEALKESEARKSAILGSALDCVVTMDHEGRIVEFNPAAERTFGYTSEQAVGEELAELLMPPDLRPRHRAGLARYLETRRSEVLGSRIEMRGLASDGREFPVELAITRIGERWPPMFTGYIRDISERRRGEEERERLLQLERLARDDADRARGQLAAILRGVANAVTAQSPQGGLIFANDSAVRLLGYRSVKELLEAAPDEILDRFELYDEEGATLAPERLPGRRALLGEQSPETVVRHVDRLDGREQWSMIRATPIFGEGGEVVMAINVIEDITGLKRAELGQRVLAECGRVLSSSIDITANLTEIPRILVPALAHWSGVHLVGGEGRAALEARAAADAETERLELERAEHPPAGETGLGPLSEALETGRPVLTPDRLVVPLASRGGVLGALELAIHGTRHFDAEDLALAEEIGRRVGAAVDNARLYAERSYIARTLQESLLPAELPAIPFLETGTRFRAAGEGNEVGGDFYDLFEAGGGRWSIVVGDVCGKGPDAAAVTALARYTLRAAAMREPSPSAGLRVLNEALLRQRTDMRFATVAYASLMPTAGGARLKLASAGHPLPLLLRRDGSAEAVGEPGTLVGVVPDPDLSDVTVELEEGDTLVIYTDGVVEARGDSGFLGERGLRELLEGCASAAPDEIAAAVEAAAVDVQRGEPRDDIAVVVVRVLRDRDAMPKG